MISRQLTKLVPTSPKASSKPFLSPIRTVTT